MGVYFSWTCLPDVPGYFKYQFLWRSKLHVNIHIPVVALLQNTYYSDAVDSAYQWVESTRRNFDITPVSQRKVM